MKTATLLAFLLLGLACTYAVTAEEEITEDEPAEEDELIENDEAEEIESDEEEEERSIIPRPRPCRRRVCRRKLVYGYKPGPYCISLCWCKRGHCKYNKCRRYTCKIPKCGRKAYPRCPY